EMSAKRDQLRLVVDRHRIAERQRRQRLRLANGHFAQRWILDQARDVVELQLANFERVDPTELETAQPDVSDAGAERLRNREDADAGRGRTRDDGVLGAGVEHEI